MVKLTLSAVRTTLCPWCAAAWPRKSWLCSAQVACVEPPRRPKKRLTALNPGVEVVVLPERLDGAALEAAVGDADIVLDGTDNFAVRFAVNRACVARRVPLV